MYYPKFLSSTLLAFCLLLSSSAQAVDFRILYQWFPGPGNTDTLKLFVESANANTITFSAINFSVAYKSTCDTIICFEQIFTTPWGTFAEGKDTAVVLPVPRVYGVESYDRRLQYGNASFGGSITAPAIGDSALLFSTIVFKSGCASLPYVEDQTDNGFNQWAFGATIYSYEIIPIVILPHFTLEARGTAQREGRARIDWEISDPAIVNRMYVYRQGQTAPLWSGIPSDKTQYTYIDNPRTKSAVYQIWIEAVDGMMVPSRKVSIEWERTADDIEIFPLPANQSLSVRWQGGAPSSGTLKLYDIQGKQVFVKNVEEGSPGETLRTADLSKGNYLLRWSGVHSFSKKVAIVH